MMITQGAFAKLLGASRKPTVNAFHVVQRKQYVRFDKRKRKEVMRSIGFFVYKNNKVWIREALTRANARELVEHLNVMFERKEDALGNPLEV